MTAPMQDGFALGEQSIIGSGNSWARPESAQMRHQAEPGRVGRRIPRIDQFGSDHPAWCLMAAGESYCLYFPSSSCWCRRRRAEISVQWIMRAG